MKKNKSTNPTLLELIKELRKKAYEESTPIWRDLAKRLAKSASRRPIVNISRISRHTKENDIVAVPGKILGSGAIVHPITTAAFNFSARAREKITAVGGRCISLRELAEEVPKGSNVKIME